VPAPRIPHGCPSHGIGLTPDEKEIWVTDAHNRRLHLFDATVNLLEPEVVIYEPQQGGHMKFVGMEYIVPLAAWESAGHDLNNPNDVPELLGQKYTRHSFLPIFKLHIWLWQNNPSGTFADWNPKVSCQHAETTEVF